MASPVNPRPVQPGAPVRKVQDAHANPQPRPLDHLILTTAGDDLEGPVRRWENTCHDLGLEFAELCLVQPEERTDSERIIDMLDQLSEWRASGRIDEGTQIMVLMHGSMIGSRLVLSDVHGQYVIEDITLFVQVLRARLGVSPQQPWRGVIHLGACRGAHERERLKDSPGITVLYNGHNVGFTDELSESYDRGLRSLSQGPRSANAPSAARMNRFWDDMTAACGEHISWCGEGTIRIHKAGDLEGNPSAEKIARVLYAKLKHGSLESLQWVVGSTADEMLARHRKAQSLPLAAASEVSGIESARKIEYLIHAGQAVNERDAYGIPPLIHAVRVGNPQAVQTLVRHGADPWARMSNGLSAWHCASHELMAMLIVDPASHSPAPALPDAQAYPLHKACAEGDLLKLAALCPRYSDLHAKDGFGNTALGQAVLHDMPAMARTLLAMKADPCDVLGNGESMLAHAVLHGQTEMVALLLSSKAMREIDHGDEPRMPLLLRAMHAVHAGRAGMKLLDLILSTRPGRDALELDFPLHYAWHLNDPALTLSLLQHGADPMLQPPNNVRALDYIAFKVHTDPAWQSAELKQALQDALARSGLRLDI